MATFPNTHNSFAAMTCVDNRQVPHPHGGHSLPLRLVCLAVASFFIHASSAACLRNSPAFDRLSRLPRWRRARRLTSMRLWPDQPCNRTYDGREQSVRESRAISADSGWKLPMYTIDRNRQKLDRSSESSAQRNAPREVERRSEHRGELTMPS